MLTICKLNNKEIETFYFSVVYTIQIQIKIMSNIFT
jgi:hypothetical protein